MDSIRDEKNRLRRQAMVNYLRIAIVHGWAVLHQTAIIVLVRCSAILIALLWLMMRAGYVLTYGRAETTIQLICSAAPPLLAVGAEYIAACYLCGACHGTWRIYCDFVRIGYINAAGECPFLISDTVDTDNPNIHIMTFLGTGFPLQIWDAEKSNLETALNLIIIKILDGNDRRHTALYTVPSAGAYPENIAWADNMAPAGNDVIALGVSPIGQVTMDFAKTYHWVIAGATGMGKSNLLRLILWQCISKKYSITIADWKHGQDYDDRFQSYCKCIFSEDELLAELADAQAEMTRRAALFAAAHCKKIEEYNAMADERIPRRLIILDETSMILDPTGRSKEEKAQIDQIVRGLAAIARLGRAWGIHVIMASQRTEVASIPGSIKAQCSGRLCAHMADNISSEVILDDGSASKLPSIPGRFILRDGSGTDLTFQAYIFD